MACSVPFRYPPSRADSLVETLHGVRVADPYRWLENADRVETRAWVDAQNQLTRSTLNGPPRDGFIEDLTRRFDYPRTTSAVQRAGRLFYTHNPGLADQPLLYFREGEAPPRILLDPNTLSADGTTALTAYVPS